MGRSQTELADAVGLTFQQIQKYERGANRIGASRLIEFAAFLGVPISYFFDDMPKDIMPIEGARAAVYDESSVGQDIDPMSRPETRSLVRYYYRIADERLRKNVYQLVKSLRTKRAAAGTRLRRGKQTARAPRSFCLRISARYGQELEQDRHHR